MCCRPQTWKRKRESTNIERVICAFLIEKSRPSFFSHKGESVKGLWLRRGAAGSDLQEGFVMMIDDGRGMLRNLNLNRNFER